MDRQGKRETTADTDGWGSGMGVCNISTWWWGGHSVSVQVREQLKGVGFLLSYRMGFRNRTKVVRFRSKHL